MICPLTNTSVDHTDREDVIYYELKYGNFSSEIFICRSCLKDLSKKFPYPYEVFKGLIANGKFPERAFVVASQHTENFPPPASSVKIEPLEFLSQSIYPRTPEQKLEKLFLNFFQMQDEEGQPFVIEVNNSDLISKNYFRSARELDFYIKGLKKIEWIEAIEYTGALTYFTISHLGLSKAYELSAAGLNSKKCFIAMSFDESMTGTQNAIISAIVSSGFEPVIVNKLHIDSDKTITDEIFTGIRKSKFCVADFTMHKHGVYFESGYAIGLGKPVIYLCHKDHLADAHFDIKQLQQIIYASDNELEKRLKDKIEAWIK